MANDQETKQAQLEPSNGNPAMDALIARLERLQEECDRLRQALAKSEEERKLYRKALYEQGRAAREFEDVDIASLEAMSAGPVGILE
jgi:hypothetical protein